jgi:hypothetical protein
VPAQNSTPDEGRPEFVARLAMSAVGQKQTLRRSNGMSALPPKADIS